VKAVYVSYDGALDPLGSSQIVPYVVGLSARGMRLSLVTFEKRARWGDVEARGALERRLDEAGVGWIPLTYHRRPRLLAKALDVAAGARAIRRAAKAGAAIVHCRGDMAMAMARSSRSPSARLLYDVRGFFADERVAGGSWSRGGIVDRAVRRLEKGNWIRANGFVVLTEAALRELGRRHPSLPPHRVIPTCVDLERFRAHGADAREFSVVYGGSMGSAYPSDAIVAFARIAARDMGAPALFLTPQQDEARQAGAEPAWSEIHTVAPAEMPAWLRRCRAAFCLYRPGPYLAATSPTKIGEALAMGLPVAVNRGIGDLDGVIEGSSVGVLIDAFTAEAYAAASARLRALVLDPGTAARCRRVAEERFSLAAGVERYFSLYQEMASAPPPA
jgi:glycosyltransferase involved in cell wall biosynthesis